MSNIYRKRYRFDVDMMNVVGYNMRGGDFMEKAIRVTIGLSPGILKKLDLICEEKGVKRPAAISFAIEKLWKEEYADKK